MSALNTKMAIFFVYLPGIPIFECFANFFICANLLVDSFRHVGITAALGQSIDEVAIKDSHVKTKLIKVSLIPSSRYERIVPWGPIQ